MTDSQTILFKEPPSTWEQYIPLGNGRLGVMLAAKPANEKLQLNEESVWSGGPIDRFNPDTRGNLEKVRTLINEGRIQEAQELTFEAFSGTPLGERVYQTAGDFNIDFFDAENYGVKNPWATHETPEEYYKSYESSLNLREACARVSYKNKRGVSFERRIWVSAPDDMIFLYVKASERGAINFRAMLDRDIWVDSVKPDGGCIYLESSNGIPFCVGAGAVSLGGEIKTVGGCLTGKACDEALFFIDIRAYRWDLKRISKAQYDTQIKNNTWRPKVQDSLNRIAEAFRGADSKEKFEKIVKAFYERHLDEYKSWYDRMSLCIGEKEDAEHTVPTPELLKNNAGSTILLQQYCNFSRYLLISSGRKPGILPATLQGIWNNSMTPPWGSKYTININLQMNYWCACPCALPELETAVFDLLERAYENGRYAAQYLYGCSGYVIHHNTDIWGDCAPQDAWLPGTYWVLGAAWLATHIYENYEYTQNKKQLQRYYYLIHEACRFFIDFLQPANQNAPDGKPYLIINPSASPENSYISKLGQTGALCAGCEMDNMILEHLFTSCIKSFHVLDGEVFSREGNKYPGEDFEKFSYVLSHLKRPSLNKDGTLMEWNEEVEEVEPGHRHVSHLYGLFPGKTLSVEKTPDLAEAARKTLEKRLKNGGGHTGWSQAWIINFRASLYEGNNALRGIEKLFAHSTLPNLLDTHPPFQIDGNFGALSGVVRMLIQSEIISETHDLTEINLRLLPALPDDDTWSFGEVKGIFARGNVRIDMAWKNGEPVRLKMTSENTKTVKVNIYKGGSDKERKANGGKCVLISSETLPPPSGGTSSGINEKEIEF